MNAFDLNLFAPFFLIKPNQIHYVIFTCGYSTKQQDIAYDETIESSNNGPRDSSLSTSSCIIRTKSSPTSKDDPGESPARLSIDHYIRNPSTSVDGSNTGEGLSPEKVSGNASGILPQHLPNANSGPLENQIDSRAGKAADQPESNATSNKKRDVTDRGVGPENISDNSESRSRFATGKIAETRGIASLTKKDEKPNNLEIGSQGTRNKLTPTYHPSTPVSIKKDNGINRIIFDGETAEHIITPSRFSTERKNKIEIKRPATDTTTSRFSTERVTVKQRIRASPVTPKNDVIVASVRSDSDYTVVFQQGEVGLQLEPGKGTNYINVCRVSRFVDGGPKSPGQARRTGKIHPGDFVMQVVADGNYVARTHDEIIQMLRNVNTERVVTLRPAFPTNRLGSVKDGQGPPQQPNSSSPLSPPAMPLLGTRMQTPSEEAASATNSTTVLSADQQRPQPPPSPIDQKNLSMASSSTTRAIPERSIGSQSSRSIDDSNEGQIIDSLQVQLFRETKDSEDAKTKRQVGLKVRGLLRFVSLSFQSSRFELCTYLLLC